jgi:hypothetical protein
MEASAKFEGWAILELMGHRRLAGYVSEQEIAGSPFVRIDVPGSLHTDPSGEQEEHDRATQFYSPTAVYCITPCVEQLARDIAETARPRPVSEWDLPRRPELEPGELVAELDIDSSASRPELL